MRLQVRLRACHGLGLAFSTQGPLKSFGTSCWSFHHLCALAAQPCLTLPCRAWEKVQVQSFGISHTRNQRKWVTAFHRKWYEFPVPSSMMWSQACSASCCWIILCQSMCVWMGGDASEKAWSVPSHHKQRRLKESWEVLLLQEIQKMQWNPPLCYRHLNAFNSLQQFPINNEEFLQWENYGLTQRLNKNNWKWGSNGKVSCSSVIPLGSTQLKRKNVHTKYLKKTHEERTSKNLIGKIAFPKCSVKEALWGRRNS